MNFEILSLKMFFKSSFFGFGTFLIGAIYLLILFKTFEMVLLSALSPFSLNFVQ